MQSESFHGASTRELVAPNVYKRRRRDGAVVYETLFRDVDGAKRRKKLRARSDRAAIREARALLAGRDDGDRVVAAELTVDEVA